MTWYWRQQTRNCSRELLVGISVPFDVSLQYRKFAVDFLAGKLGSYGCQGAASQQDGNGCGVVRYRVKLAVQDYQQNVSQAKYFSRKKPVLGIITASVSPLVFFWGGGIFSCGLLVVSVRYLWKPSLAYYIHLSNKVVEDARDQKRLWPRVFTA